MPGSGSAATGEPPRVRPVRARREVPDHLFDRAYEELGDPEFRDLSPAVFTAWGRRP
ncbi:hypothetical protein [Sphaerisporangium album]|uniref:hypothetical protein n=1 Tax=Sphaerisporangium album TaxID=509200 RepID=UPI0015F10896|nr:hypothetical protein [Sphaerisporangium album]